MARIFKVKKSWYIDYNLDGKRIKKAIGRSKQIAQLALSDIEVQKLEKRLGQEPPKSRPILSEIPAGHPQEYTDQDYPPSIAEDYYEFKVNDPNAFFLRVKGDCMAPEIKEGDLILVHPNDEVENGDIVVIKINKEQKEVRRTTFQTVPYHPLSRER